MAGMGALYRSAGHIGVRVMQSQLCFAGLLRLLDGLTLFPRRPEMPHLYSRNIIHTQTQCTGVSRAARKSVVKGPRLVSLLPSVPCGSHR